MSIARSSIRLQYNQKETSDLGESSFSYTDHASGEADSLAVTFDDQSGRWEKGFYPKESDSVKAWIIQSDWFTGKADAKLYCGEFLLDRLNISGFPAIAELSGLSVPINSDINVTQKSRTWKKVTVKRILQDIADKAGIRLIYEADSYRIDEITQSARTDLDFAYSVCSDYGLAMKLYNKKLVAYDRGRYEKRSPAYTIRKEDLGGNGAFSLDINIASLHDAVKIQYTGKDRETVTYSFIRPGKKGKRVLFLTAKASSHQEAEIKAKTKLREDIRGSRRLVLSLAGNVRYRSAENFKLEGFGKADGVYFIDSAVHDRSQGKYTCTIEAHPVLTDF